ncbi:related to sexual differentiation process protein ISP4 [Zygosaccharomyces bailii]|nr:related to sexual differentiation process protein ISP4 [Zygosaccharomyces bailii]
MSDENHSIYEGEMNHREEVGPTFKKDPVSINVVKSEDDSTGDGADETRSIESLTTNHEEELLPEDLKSIPKMVRQVVTLEDDPHEPCFTFRVVVLSIIFILPGAFLDTLNSYRTTSAAYSVFFVQICSYWFGKWLAKVLPDIKIGIGNFKFSLNPGPWSIKENVLITLAAASGATGNQGTTPISLAEIYYKTKVNPAVAIFFMWSINFSGYALSYIARNFLIYEPQFIWPQALMQTNLFNSMKSADANDSKEASRKLKYFFIAVIGMTVWEFLPEYVFPMLSSLSFICWVAPENYVANFVGGGMGGMGFLNQSLDWSNITSSVLLSPYWTICIQFAAFVFSCWILIPAAKWGNLSSYKHGLMSNHLLTSNGTLYPVNDLITYDHSSTANGEVSFNHTAYEKHGPVYIGAQQSWNIFFDYAAFTSAITWIVLFGRKEIVSSFKKLKERFLNKRNINKLYNDRLNDIQSQYEEVPVWWFAVLWLITVVIFMTIFATNRMFIPWWTYFVALGISCIIIIPLAYLYAISNFQLAIGAFDELLYGVMVQNLKSHKHPAGASTYGAMSGDLWYRAQYMLQDQKIGHYMHIPPKAVFMSQILGQLIGVPMNYGTVRWVLDTKMPYLRGIIKDPLHQWTGQGLTSYNTEAVLYVLIGPTKFFSSSKTKVIPFGLLVGFFAPFIIYVLYKLVPKMRFDLWNVTIFCSTMSNFYGNLSTGYSTQFIVGTFSMYFLFNYKPQIWRKYNYLTAAAFDTGYNLAVLLIFIIFSSGKTISMPNWWGNNAVSVERCFALEKA